MNVIPETLFRVGRTRATKAGRYMRSQDAEYYLDAMHGPLLRVTWEPPGLWGKQEQGEFIFRKNAVAIGKINESDIPAFAKEAAALNAKSPHSGTWTLVAGPLGALAAVGVTALSQKIAERKETGTGLKGIGVYYSTTGDGKNQGFFVGIAIAKIIEEIIANVPSDMQFEFTPNE